MAESSTAQYTVGPPTVTAAAAAVGPASLDGEALQVAYFTSDVWAEQRPLVDACCASGPIGQITLPPRIYARDASFQVGLGCARVNAGCGEVFVHLSRTRSFTPFSCETQHPTGVTRHTTGCAG